MAEKTDWAKLSKRELQEMLQRQEKLLANKNLLQSLPDQGHKVLTTVTKIRDLISRREELEQTVTQLEKMTVSQLAERTWLDSMDSGGGDEDDDFSDIGNKTFVNSSEEKPVSGSDLQDKPDSKMSFDKQTGENSKRKWDYESSATPPVYKLEKAKPISLDESFKLLQDQEKRYKDLQAQHATVKLKEHGSFGRTDHTTLQFVNKHLQYREVMQDDCLSDDSEQEENEGRPIALDSDDDDNNGD